MIDPPMRHGSYGFTHETIWARWGAGVVGAAAIAVYGLTCILLQRGVLIGGWRFGADSMTLTGGDATALGIACLAGALVLHCHYYWEARYADHPPVTLAKAVGMLALVGAVGYLLVRVVVWG